MTAGTNVAACGAATATFCCRCSLGYSNIVEDLGVWHCRYYYYYWINTMLLLSDDDLQNHELV
jgi:hypothetical protein